MRLKISGLFRLVIATLAIISVVAYGFLEFDHPYIDTLSLLLMLLFAAVLYFFSGKFSSKHPPAIIITLLLILFVQLRACVLIMLPDSLIQSGSVTSEMFNVTLGYMTFGAVACYMGLALGYGKNGNPDARTMAKNLYGNGFQLKFLGMAFLLSLVLTLLVYYVFGYAGATGSGENLGFFQRYVARVIYPIGWLMMFMAAYALYSGKASYAWLFLTVLFLYFMSFVLMGSRGGIYEIVIIFLSYKLIVDGNFSVKLNGWRIVALISMIPLILVAYEISTLLRASWYGNDFSVASIIDAMPSREDGFSAFTSLISAVSYRLSFFEPTMFPIFAQDVGLNEISELVNIETTLLSSINRLIPGHQFGDILFSEYAFGFIYNAKEGILAYAESGRVDHVGYEWSMFGISYQLFGFLGGGMLIFGFTALLGRIIGAFNAWGNFYGLACSFFFMAVLSIWVRNMGLDNLIDRTVHGLIVLCIYFAIYWMVMSLLKLNGYQVRGADR
ncbi:MAG: hypothetical protein PHG47_03425 [Sulfuricella sp.]|nr:hypothetical protein [Sulfuricella sp.]